jgi:hypothetical protein
MVPDQLFDELLPHLKEAELKVLLYIIRRTFGFKKESDAISFSQFLNGITTNDGRVLDEGCGLNSRTSLSRALQDLEAKGIIEALKRTDENGEREINVYRLRFLDGEVVRKVYYPSTPRALPVVRETYLQETVKQETVKQETDSNLPPLAPSTSTQDVPESTVLEITIKTCSQQFADLEHLDSNIAQAYNLWRSTDLDEEGMLAKVQEARQITLRRISSSQVKDRTKKMAYFFRVLEDVLGLKQAKS